MSDKPVVLVTGASSGIGKLTAELFTQNGYQVFGTSRTPGESSMLKLDVTQPESISACVEHVIQQAGRIDVLVNNAGLAHISMIEETHAEAFMPVYETNLFGMVRMTQAVLPYMRVQKSGHIIGVGSLGARVALPGTGHYAATKSALVSIYGALRYEVKPFNIKVAVVEPGRFASEMSAHAIKTQQAVDVYDSLRNKMLSMDLELEAKAPQPHAVAAKILKIARTKNPRFRYLAGNDAYVVNLIHNLLPYNMFERIVQRMFS